MSRWKSIDKSQITNEETLIHKKYELNQSSAGIEFIQFKSGSSVDFPNNDSGSYWDANRVNFYLSGSQFDFQSSTSSFEDGKKMGQLHNSFFPFNTENPTYRNKFHSTGSSLSVSQHHFGDAIKRGSFKLTDNSHPSGTVIIVDDGYGNLYAPSASITSSGETSISSSDNYIGNIAYNLGIINITETGSFNSDISYKSVGTGLDGGIGSGSYKVEFESTHKIFSTEYTIKVNKDEFNYTNNITAKKFALSGPGSSSLLRSPFLKDNIASSSLDNTWGPLMTTIGFYIEYDDGTIYPHPVMVAKYPQPIMMRKDVDLIFKVRIDT